MAAQSERPNVLLMYTDQQRWDTIRAAGNCAIHTPNLDRLAEQGVLFDRTYVNCPVCMPSRQSMLSGLYPSVVGCTINGSEMPEDQPCLHNYLKPYGYHTAQLGKLHFKNHSARDHREAHPTYGFDTIIISDEPGCYDDAYIKWVEQQAPDQVWNCRCTSAPACVGPRIEKQPRNTHEPYVFEGPEHLTHSAFVASQTIETIRLRQNEPWFTIAGFYAPHTPVNPPQRFIDMYNVDDMPLPHMNEGEDQYGLSDDEWKNVKLHYYALISHVDDLIGRIMKALEETGQRDNTLIIFTSDHGEHLGDHGRVQKGMPGWDSSARVPLIVSMPQRYQAGVISDELIEHVDLVPTVLDCCGIQTPLILQGRSFRGLLDGSDYTPRTSAFMELHHNRHGQKAIATKTHKYNIDHQGFERLYDLTNDPHELTNLADQPDHTQALADMRLEMLKRWHEVQPNHRPRTAQY